MASSSERFSIFGAGFITRAGRSGGRVAPVRRSGALDGLMLAVPVGATMWAGRVLTADRLF